MEETWYSEILADKERYYRLAYSYVKNAQDALDIVQESMYQGLRQYKSLKNKTAVKTWFYRIVVNTSLNHLKKYKRQAYLEEEQWEGIPGQDNADLKEAAMDLRDAIDSLPLKYRTVIVLRYFEDMKIEVIAEILDENVNTVKTRIYKALKLLRVEMDER